MKSEPLISVILPVYNGEKYLNEALQSVFDQDYPHFEVLVVDDGSTDISARIARSFQVRYMRQSNSGVAAARNAGIGMAHGEYIAFIDQDDTWLPEKLKKQAHRLASDAELGFVLAHQVLNPVGNGPERASWLRSDHMNIPLVGYLPSAMLIRRAVFSQIGKFDVSYDTSSDAEWYFRAQDNHIKMEVLPEVLVRRKIHETNQSTAISVTHSELLKMIGRSVLRKRMNARGSVS